ncbi:MAG: hypothetical protein ACRCYY_14800 [Trueperaceae bacterium]
MENLNYVCWQNEAAWLGDLESFPDYWTQGKTKLDLEDNLMDICKELMSGCIPHIRSIEPIWYLRELKG